MSFRHYLGLGLQDLETQGFQHRFSYVFLKPVQACLSDRLTIFAAGVPKSYKHVRKGIRSATFTHLTPGDLIPKSIPGKNLITKALKGGSPAPLRSQSWQQKHSGQGSLSDHAVIVRCCYVNNNRALLILDKISFSSSDDDQGSWSTADTTMVSVRIPFVNSRVCT